MGITYRLSPNDDFEKPVNMTLKSQSIHVKVNMTGFFCYFALTAYGKN